MSNLSSSYKLHLERTISASHYLKYHKGKCSSLHGHSFKVIVDIKDVSNILELRASSGGMVVDFGDIKEIIDVFDHKCINEVVQGKLRNKWLSNLVPSYMPEHEDLREVEIESCLNQPTAERLAEYFAKEIGQFLCTEGSIVDVIVVEEEGQWAGYTHVIRNSLR